MELQKRFKNKIGARCLSEEEAKQILPTYDQIKEQIKFFREEVSTSDTGENKIQKTNNIGIIGVRGAGKTSILKTIREELKKESHQQGDIVLPIVIPENMSESSTLMATILGMLGEEVKRCVKEEEERQNREIKKEIKCLKIKELVKKYDATVKQYTFIQKEYRDLLIQEYTTENDYVKDCAKVFNSDIEFIDKFNELIKALACHNQEIRGLIFIFIDDIDLSTYRCAEVVKTLLSYLSSENIVTFISGDLDTFEEALTLDFIRKDQVMRKDILEEYVLERNEKTILKSKQQLAYEYLKKILPPMYRHNVKHWSLQEKGQYKIVEDRTSENIDKSEDNFSNLLLKALRDWMDLSFFFYKEGEHVENLPYTYHLFDDTARGLNNVYSVLGDIASKRERSKKDEMEDKQNYQEDKKRLIDTIIASKPIYNRYRDDIQRRMINIGNNQKDNKVFFDNANAIIYKEREPEQESQTRKKEGTEKREDIKNHVERFSLFVLVDFAARILYEKEYQSKIEQDDSYSKLKEKAMEELFFHPVVAEKTLEYSEYQWQKKDSKGELGLYEVNRNFLLKGDFIFNLAYYKNLSLDKIVPLYQTTGTQKQMKETMDLKHHSIIAMWKAFKSVAYLNNISISEKIAQYYPIYQGEFSYIQKQLSGSVVQNVIMRLFEEECDRLVKKKYEKDNTLIVSTKYVLPPKDEKFLDLEQWCMKRLLLNRIAEYLKNETESEQKNSKNDIDNLKKIFSKQEVLDRIEVLRIIDSKQLWQFEAADIVVSYLKKNVEEWINTLISELWNSNEQEQRLLNTARAIETCKNFFKGYDGVSRTKAKITKENIAKILRNGVDSIRNGINFYQYAEVVLELSNLVENPRIWYGKYEAQEFLNDLQDVVMERKVVEEIKKIEEYNRFLLRYYMKYKMAIQDSENVKKDAELLQEVTKELSKAHKSANEKVLQSFINILNSELGKKVDEEWLGVLFSEKEEVG